MRYLLLLMILASPSAALALDFRNWKEQRFSLFSANTYVKTKNTVSIQSDGTVSLLWSPAPAEMQNANTARWQWNVTKSVPATDLTIKGGDDRNLSLYFVFAPAQEISATSGASIKTLMASPSARVLMYVYGGKHKRGAILPSPFLKGLGKTLVLRPAGTGAFTEQVNLENDFFQAFGEVKTSLVGLAISSDSDDTATDVAAQISNLMLAQ
jgi:hypothetical protein